MRAAFSRTHEFIAQDSLVRTVASDPVASTVASYSFQISDVPFLVGMAALFEYFKIIQVDVVYKPFVTQVNTPSDAVASPSFIVPDMVYSWDPYSNVPTNYDLVAGRGSAVIKSTLERWSSSFRPTGLIRGYKSLTGDAFLNLGPQWISTDQPDTPHYGLLIGIEPSVGVNPVEFGGRVTFHYRVQFKNPKSSFAFSASAEEKKD